jgi:signal transduction histidine kinase
LKHIFEPFYRTPEAAAAQIHGTGLGLSLAKHLAEAMGGRLTVTSQLESGSIFTLHLQLSPDQNHRVPTESNEALIR